MTNARTIGGYDLEGLLGEGGIGQVYAAQDRVLGRHVAVKMLRPELSRDRNFVDRFYVEAKSLGNLNHPNITTIYALHAEGDEAFMVMELVRGYTLEEILARVHRLTLRDSLAVLAQAAAGIGYAHRMGVIHRDIKPANLMVTHDGILKIMDFGIARVQGSQHLTRVGEFCGTFVYASPEQIRGDEVDERSDLYSLAIVFYRMLAGHAPFTSDNEYALMTAQLQTPPPPLSGQVADLDAATEQVLMRALAKRPEDRFRSVEEFARAAGATALRGEAVDILERLCSRVFDENDLDKTRIVRTGRPLADQTLPSNRPAFRLVEAAALPSLSGARPAASEPWSNGTDRRPAAPLPATAAPQPILPASRSAGRRSWLIGAAALALPLLLGAGYYLLTANRVTSSSSIPAQHQVAEPPSPAPVETATTEPLPPPTPVETAKTAPPPPAPVEAAKTEPPPAPVETAKTEPPPPAPVETAKTEPPQAPVQTAKTEPPPPAPAETAKTEPPPPAPVQTAKTEPPPPAPAETAKTEPPAPAPSIPNPEGRPDLQGRVTGAKGLHEIELDRKKWITIYGIVDRSRGAQEAQHAEALVRYLKLSRNHLVCYRKPGDTYRCYSDGQDIARLALADRLVQLAPNAPAEYRSLRAGPR